MSNVKTYIYHGPSSGTTLETPDGPKEYLFFEGKSYDLPPENEYVQCLVRLKHLEESKVSKASTAKKPAKAQTTQEDKA